MTEYRELPRIPPGAEIALDLETYDPMFQTHGPGWCFPNAGNIIGFALGWGDDGAEESDYWPFENGFRRYLDDLCRRTDLTFVFHNRIYDEGWLRRSDIPLRSKGVDTGIASPLLDEYRYSYDLDALTRDYLPVEDRKRKSALSDWQKRYNLGKPKDQKILGRKRLMADLRRVPFEVLRTYAAGDGSSTLKLWRCFKPMLDAQRLWNVFNLETELIPILLEMRWRGIRVDLDAAERASAKYRRRHIEIMSKLESLLGFGIDIWNANSLAKAFDSRGLSYPLTRKTKKPSFKKANFEALLEAFPGDEFVTLLQEARANDKTRNTFVDGYILDKAVNGRVHSSYHPVRSDEGGAVTGRFSSSGPNTTNLPNPEKNFEMGVLVRGFFLPEVGQKWGAIDYKQQEPRLMVHFAERPDVYCPGAREAGDMWRANPDMSIYKYTMDISGLPKYQAKIIFLGKAYGMGGAKYCHDLGLPTEWIERKGKRIEVAGPEGQEQLNAFNNALPWIETLSQECQRRARRRGYIRTLSGRRCRFSETGQDEYGKDFFYRAMNRLIQGSAADQTKMAVIEMWKHGYVPLVIPHDETGHSVESVEEARKIARIMEETVKLSVPVRTDIALGDSWGECVELEDERAVA